MRIYSIRIALFLSAILALFCFSCGEDAGDTAPLSPPPEKRPSLDGVPAEEVAYLEDASLAALDTAKDTLYFSLFERYIVLEINRVRADPRAWCEEVGLYGEGSEVQDWAEGFSGAPLPPLQPRKGLWLSARYWSAEQKRMNESSHANMGSRISHYGKWSGAIGENVGPPGNEDRASGPAWFASGGLGNARKYSARVVNEFIRDRGVPGKGHRNNIMSTNYRYVGIGVVDGWITMEFAKGYEDKPEAAATDVWQ